MPFEIQPLREFLVRPAIPAALVAPGGAGLQPALHLGADDPIAVPAAGSGALEELRPQPRPDAGAGVPGGAGARGGRSALPGAVPAGLRAFDAYLQPGGARPAGEAGRLLLHGVRAGRVPADLLGRPGRAGGRLSEGRSDSGEPAGGRRPALPEGLSAAVPQPGRLAAGTLSGQRLLHAAVEAGHRRRGQSISRSA